MTPLIEMKSARSTLIHQRVQRLELGKSAEITVCSISRRSSALEIQSQETIVGLRRATRYFRQLTGSASTFVTTKNGYFPPVTRVQVNPVRESGFC